ncbi:MAG: ACP S-malonyltransferase [Spirochaetes bacterium]|nr:ACP S-malonyltransferase [Spirochaetota bacterium]
MKIALLFAGQGAQFVGMGKDLYDNFDTAKKIFDEAESILNSPIKKVCFEGPEEELKKTENTQPAVLLLSYICYKLLENEGFKFETFAGFSLGEYSALTSSNVIALNDSLNLVRQRGLIMEKAVPEGKGGMAAVLGLSDKEVEQICKDAGGIVVPANYNCPGQLVISGEKEAVIKAADLADQRGAKRTVILNVSGPFHSPMLENASLELKNVLDKITFNKLSDKKVMSNVTANYHSDNEIKSMLVKQMHSPVLWRKCIENLISQGYDTFVELGPGRVLTGFMRSIDRTKKALSVNNLDSLKTVIEELKK